MPPAVHNTFNTFQQVIVNFTSHPKYTQVTFDRFKEPTMPKELLLTAPDNKDNKTYVIACCRGSNPKPKLTLPI